LAFSSDRRYRAAHWQDALGIGLELIREFPNARMANEVREALDTLRERRRQGFESEEAGTKSS